MLPKWKPIPGYPGYEVSDQGQVRSQRGVLSAHTVRGGYKLTYLYLDRKRYHFFIHRLVMTVFVGPCPEGYEIDHIDGDPANNALTNLRYVTHSENMKAAVRRWGSNWHCGETNPLAKLTAKQVVEARRLYAEGTTMSIIARLYGVNTGTIHDVIKGRTWKHLA